MTVKLHLSEHPIVRIVALSNEWLNNQCFNSDLAGVWLPQQRILFGGCFVKANSLGNLSDADVNSWPESARNLISRYGNAALVVPGHGEVVDMPMLCNSRKITKK